MCFYRHRIYPYLVSKLGDPPPIREIRKRIVPLALETVLEIGVGPGVNFIHYDPSRVSKIYALEPNAGMIRLAVQQRHRTQLAIELLDLPGERIPLEDESVNTVVSTFTLCTIPDVLEAIRGIKRVLRPNGKFIFFEHGLSPDSRVQRWQRWSEPITRFVFEGCHVTRDIPSLITQGGFEIEQIERGYLTEFPKSWTYCFWGTCKRSREQPFSAADMIDTARLLAAIRRLTALIVAGFRSEGISAMVGEARIPLDAARLSVTGCAT